MLLSVQEKAINQRTKMQTSFWDAYDYAVVEIMKSGRAVTMNEICDQLDLMRDELEAITARLVARGTIEPEAFSA
jgi:hypothetical protein